MVEPQISYTTVVYWETVTRRKNAVKPFLNYSRTGGALILVSSLQKTHSSGSFVCLLLKLSLVVILFVANDQMPPTLAIGFKLQHPRRRNLSLPTLLHDQFTAQSESTQHHLTTSNKEF